MYTTNTGDRAECGRTTQKPDTLRFGSLREHLHTLTLTGVNIIFLAPFKPYRLGVNGKMHMPVRRIKAFLQDNTSPVFRLIVGGEGYSQEGRSDQASRASFRRRPCVSCP